MSLIPDFQIGLWNGWILSAIFLVHHFLMKFIIPKENKNEMMDQVKQTKGKIRGIIYGSLILYYGIMICATFMPLQLRTLWFYTGLAIFTPGMILLIVVEVQLHFRKPGTLMTTGFYSISRNPQYVMMYITWIGIGVVTASWVILMLVFVSMIVQHFMVLGEEQICLEKYGDTYREYMNRTPRYLGVPKKDAKNAFNTAF